METVTRKTLLYKSGLGFWCINHVQGCAHACRYPCYAFMMARHHGRVPDLATWVRPKLVANAVELLGKELRRRRGIDRVHLCLTTDPFMFGQSEVTALSLTLVEMLNREGIACSLLTKGELPLALADKRRFPCDNTCGVSLVSLNEGFRAKWELGAAPYTARITALRALHDRGCRTRVHMEPYPPPNVVVQDVEAILSEVDFVDEVFFGKWNYNRSVEGAPGIDAFYAEQARIVRRFCAVHGIEHEA